MIEKDKFMDSFINSMLKTFRKLEKKDFNIEIDDAENENEMTFFNPSDVEKPCQQCNYETHNNSEL